jgi:hypothetical protein
MIKEANYGQILFHIKGNIEEPVVVLYVNSLYEFAMTQLGIPRVNKNGLIEKIR